MGIETEMDDLKEQMEELLQSIQDLKKMKANQEEVGLVPEVCKEIAYQYLKVAEQIEGLRLTTQSNKS